MIKPLLAASSLVGLIASHASASVIMDWDASNYTGSGSWIDSVASVEAVPGGISAPGPALETAAIGGQSVDVIRFTRDSFDVNSTAHPLVGLKEFSISILFEVTSTANAGPADQFWTWNGLVGKELGGPRAGDWAMGIASGGVPGGATGIADGAFGNAGDLSTVGPNDIVNTGYHSMTLVVDDNGDNTFNQYLYLDGVLQNSNLNVTYGGVAQIAGSNFAIGARRDGDNGYLESGAIGRLLFDNTALSAAEVTALHATSLGEVVPEPGVSLLAALGAFGLLRRRCR